MCGIFGVVGVEPVVPVLVEGLRRLEYRGYDSAGIAIIGRDGLSRICAAGKVERLAAKVADASPTSRIGIAHTRWATHGAPNEGNSHPHLAQGIAAVHNGIVENYRSLRAELSAAGCRLVSETDSEVIPWLVHRALAAGENMDKAIQGLGQWLEGSYAVAFLNAAEPDVIYAKRQGSPLVAALGPKGGYISSDIHALAGLAEEVIVLEDGDRVAVRRDSIVVHDMNDRLVTRPTFRPGDKQKPKLDRHYAHHMHREIHEQPRVLRGITEHYAAPDATSSLDGLALDQVQRIRLVACGTSFFASMVAKTWFAEVAGLAAEVEIASEFRYAPEVTSGVREIAILVSQSGETADTLACFDLLRQKGTACIGIVNNPASSLARGVDVCLDLHAGAEIGVASTKAFTAQLGVLAYLVARFADARGRHEAAQRLRMALGDVPKLIEQILAAEVTILPHATNLSHASNAIFVGRGLLYPMALEGALKLKEISYIHAEGFAAGELKHGPIALVDVNTPVIALATNDATFAKIASNVREIAARGGRILTIGDDRALGELSDIGLSQILLPDCDPLVMPFIAAVPLQLLAYYTAVLRGSDVDRPRNLAKSVTVE